MDDGIDDLMSLFDKPQEPHRVSDKKPNRCSVCGCRTKRLKPKVVGKTTLYICKFCQSLVKGESE